MALAKFDPWQCLRQTQVNAYPAYSAYQSASIGRIGMLGTEAPALIGDFEERAAILEFTGGLKREDAERVAADSVGLASPRELQAVAIQNWRTQLSQSNGRGQGLIADALKLVNGPWIAVLIALGWDEVSLFGCNPTDRDVGGLVAAIRRRSILAATADSVRYLGPHGGARHHYRFAAATANVCLIWELGADSNDGEHARTSAEITMSSI